MPSVYVLTETDAILIALLVVVVLYILPKRIISRLRRPAPVSAKRNA